MADRQIQDIYPLAPTQEGMLFHTLFAPESGAYVEQASGTLRGELDRMAFEQAWQRLMDRHSVLRTAFVWQEVEEPVQVVYRRLPVPLAHRDWRARTAEQREAQLEALRQEERARGFDMSEAPLMRLHLIRSGEDTHELIWTYHHVLLDGWSLPILFQEVFALYEALAARRPLVLPPTRPYRDYIAWLQRQDPGEAERFWRQALVGFKAPTPLPVDRLPAPDAAECTAEQDLVLAPQLSGQLAELARQTGITPNTLLQAAWALVLSRTSGQDDVLFGATVSGRPTDLPGAETMVGLFISTLPVRVRVEPGLTVRAWLHRLQEQQAGLLSQKANNLVQIQGWSEVPRDRALFESILVYENYPSDAALEEQLAGARGPAAAVGIENVRSREQTNYPLTVVAGLRDVLMLRFSYDCRRFEAQTIGRMLGHLETLLAGMVAAPDGLVQDLPMITAEESRQILETWNDTARAFPGAEGRGIHELVAAQAGRTPDRTAVELTGIDGEVSSLSYGELDQRTNQLAHLLQRLGVGPETLVGLQVERSLEMLVGLLGILKAGGAYLPLDPTYPRQRLDFMLQDSGARILLTQEALLPRIPDAYQRLQAVASTTVDAPCAICLDADWPLIAQEAVDRPPSQTGTDNLAYVIYTSGSTGTPKGVAVGHGSLTNHTCAMAGELGLSGQDRMLQFISVSFDAAGEELYPTLISGATLVMPQSTDGLLGAGLFRYCEQHGVTVLHMPASAWHAALDDLAAKGTPIDASLRLLSLGGDAPSVPRLRAFNDLMGRPIAFINLYGPTESTITATVFHGSTAAQGRDRLPIGRPIANNRAYVLDRSGRPVPVGVPGELAIGGAGVARGYLARPDLTAERFVPDPFGGSQQPAARLYRTGDLARWLPDGNLEFLGRMDDQVKIRGFRVELGEVETALAQHAGVQAAVVMAIAGDGTDRRLIAYWVPRGDQAATVSDLRRYLSQRLPSYMVPSAFVSLDALPLTSTGKIDRAALPAPDGGDGEGDRVFVPPRTAEEEILSGMLAQLLRIERVGATDSFFDLGGHSLLATRLASRIREVFGVELPLRTIFDHPTVMGLAAVIGREVSGRGAQAGAGLPINRPPGQPIPLSFAQQRLWFLDQLEPGNLFYNIPTAVRLVGRLDVRALQRAMDEIVRRHEVLRTTFDTVDGTPVQVIKPEHRVELQVVDLRDSTDPEAEALSLATMEARTPFDLAHGPLLRAKLFQLAADDAILLVVIHHIVADGWSLGILVQELATLYKAFAAGQASTLPELPVQYADYALWQRRWLAQDGEEGASAPLQGQLAYWREQLAGVPPLLELPTDRPRPAVQTSNGATLAFTLPADLSAAVRTLGRREGTTLYMTLLAAYQLLLARYSGQDDVCVGSVVANRGQTAWEPLIGFFVNTLVLRTRFGEGLTFRELLSQVRHTTLEAYAHQDVPFEMLVDALQPERSLSHTPLFQAAFSLQNTPMPEASLPGLALRGLAIERGATQFDMLLTMSDTAEGLAGAWEYNGDLFDESTIGRMAGHLQVVLAAMVADPDQPVAAVPLLTAGEREQVLVAWNDTAVPLPQDRTLHGLVEEQAAQQPGHPAVVFAGPGGVETLTYGELVRRANQLAHRLRSHGAGPGTLVAIALQRSLQVPVAVLAVLKAGAAFVPVDPGYPAERVRFMLEDSAAPIVLAGHTGERTAEAQRAQSGTLDQRRPQESRRGAAEGVEAEAVQPMVIELDAEWRVGEGWPDTPPQDAVGAEGLAYCIYTSGSTGTPKGTLLRQRGLANLAQVQRRAFEITPHSRILQFAPLSFDASVWELTMALANGATLVMAPQDTLASGPELRRLLRDQAITTVTLPPSLLAILEPGDLPALATVVAAGERCTRDIVQRWAPGRRFFNAYGPTETTVCASMALCTEEDEGDPSIGRPIDNFQLYVVDANLQPVPVGVPGELLIAGVGLAEGYLNRPELTAQRFRTVVFGKTGPVWMGRVYRTGDLVRWRPDGTLDFLGRLDHQVKLRGFRIELGEVETALRSHPAVLDAVAVARDDALAAYVIPKDGHELAVADLRSFLRQSLPEHMVPTAFVEMETFPLTPAGKIDRQALPPPGAERQAAGEYVAPRSATEARLAQMAAGLLKLERIGVEDNFFELGGHSLLATQLISRIREEMAVDVPLRSLFERPTVAGLAAAVDEARAKREAGDATAEPTAPAITARPRGGRRMTLSQLEAEEGAGAGETAASGDRT